MPVVVEVVDPDAYQAWVATQKDEGTRVAATR
jgi:heme/copper-type cytochrome/quinol oxidase subunit 2